MIRSLKARFPKIRFIPCHRAAHRGARPVPRRGQGILGAGKRTRGEHGRAGSTTIEKALFGKDPIFDWQRPSLNFPTNAERLLSRAVVTYYELVSAYSSDGGHLKRRPQARGPRVPASARVVGAMIFRGGGSCMGTLLRLRVAADECLPSRHGVIDEHLYPRHCKAGKFLGLTVSKNLPAFRHVAMFQSATSFMVRAAATGCRREEGGSHGARSSCSAFMAVAVTEYATRLKSLAQRWRAARFTRYAAPYILDFHQIDIGCTRMEAASFRDHMPPVRRRRYCSIAITAFVSAQTTRPTFGLRTACSFNPTLACR